MKNYFFELSSKNISSLAVVGSARALILACYYVQNKEPILVIVPGNKNASDFAAELKRYLGVNAVYEYENYGILQSNKSRDSANRLKALGAIIRGEDKIVVASSASVLRKLPNKIKNFCSPLKLEKEKEYDYELVLNKLSDMAYTRIEVIDGPGTFSVHGDTIDIFPAQYNYPVRIEFFGDEIEDIRKIVMGTGQSIKSLNKIEIYPAKNILYDTKDIFRAKEKLEGQARTNKVIREYLEKLERKVNFDEIEFLEPYIFEKMLSIKDVIHENTHVFFNEPRAILDDMRHYYEDLNEDFKSSGFSKDSLFCNPSEFNLNDFKTTQLLSIMQKGILPNAKLTFKRPVKHSSFEHLISVLKDYINDGFYVLLSIINAGARRQVMMDLVEGGLSVEEHLSSDNKKLNRRVVNVCDFPTNMSYIIADAKIVIISLAHFGNSSDGYYDQSTRHYVDITKITFPYNPGDYVVHSFYGIGLFKDIVKREIGDSIRDYLLLEYAENDKLYVPIEQFGRVTKYVGPQGTKPNLTRLGSQDWSKAISKAKKATKKMAFDLVDVYSRRVLATGHSFSCDNNKQKKMEDDFPYMETEDQLNAILEVKQDMENIKPMDRLICGDVGFGKTEVALRAAFKCVQDKMQVMVLCPTTILAQQHYTTFYKRLDFYGVKVEVLSRFKTNKECKIIAEDFKEGKLDILIGTHRLLSRDINPKNLGLIIIDEEQRFGVAHKEQLKNFRESVDVLTLTATPIPRTMQMATSGVRDMSLIMTPPVSRKAVEVYVGEWDVDIVSEAIRRETARGGQVYYISNRIRTINDAVERVGVAAGEARIGVVHGRMKKAQLESVMEEFSVGKFDVLVSTTIIENGIDNPNTNTLIIEDAQNLGLSQMYQLKGRVGRSVDQAYAYFMFSDQAMLNKDAIARLSAIDEFSDLGSGMQIAMRDLEIRGAGNFLGAEQSGNVSHIGFDLFSQMLKSAVEKAQNYESDKRDSEDLDYLEPSISDVSVNIPGSAYFSSDVIPNVEDRVIWYRRFSCAQSLDEICMLEQEILKTGYELDSFCNNYIFKSKIAAYALKEGIKLISIVNGCLILEGKKLSYSQVKELKQIEGRYLDRKRKISIPLDRIIDKSDDKLFGQIFDFLINWEF